MSRKTKIAAMTAQQFGQFTRDHKQSIVAFSAALLFALDQCSNGRTNTNPLNEVLRLPVCQFKNRKLSQFGAYVRMYSQSLLHGSADWQSDRGRFQFQSKHETVYIDVTACLTFAEFYAAKGTAKTAKDTDPQPVSAATLTKTISRAVNVGMTAKDAEIARELLAAIPSLQSAALALVQSMNAKRDDNAATVTDGSTGEETRKQAHAPAETKMETATARKPASEAKLAELAKVYAKPETKAA